MTAPGSDPTMRSALDFARALGKLKAKDELGQGADLTPEEVTGIIWGIKNLRRASDPVCWCCNKRASQIDHERVGKP
jgi:hypothetical protein